MSLVSPLPAKKTHLNGADNREADHRIANSLGIISALVRLEALKAGRGKAPSSDAARAILEQVAMRIDTVGRLHRRLNSTSGNVSANEYLSEVCGLTQDTLDPARAFALRLRLDPELRLPAAQMTHVGLFVNEALTNAFKYAHPSATGQINIICHRNAGAIQVAIEDDGPGLPADFNGGGLGFRIMGSLADELDARLSHLSGPQGLRLEIVLPA